MPQPREQQANARNQCSAYVSTVAAHTYFLSLMDAIHDGLELCSRSGSMSWASFSSDLAISGHHRLAARAQQVQNQHDVCLANTNGHVLPKSGHLLPLHVDCKGKIGLQKS